MHSKFLKDESINYLEISRKLTDRREGQMGKISRHLCLAGEFGIYFGRSGASLERFVRRSMVACSKKEVWVPRVKAEVL